VIDGNIEKSHELLRVQIHRQHPVRARGRDQVRHQLGRDRHPRLVFAVLPRISKNGTTAVMRLALARRHASIMINNSIK